MGKWFPGIRTASKEQTAAYRDAQKNLERHGQEVRARGNHQETSRYYELNHAVSEAVRPLSRPQRFLHFNRAIAGLDLEDARRQRDLAREARQSRAAARTGRTR
jgi:hypothetical protein